MSISAAPRRALIAGLYGALATGCFYAFGDYSGALQDKFDLSSKQLSNINTIPFAFGLISPFSAAFGRQIGTRLSLAVGGLLSGGLQLLLFFITSGSIDIPYPPVTLVVVAVLIYLGNTLIASVAFSAPILHFPRMRGEVTALVKSFVGLGGEVVTQLFVLLCGSDMSGPIAFRVLLLWCVVTLSSSGLAALIVPARVDPQAREPELLLRVLFWELLLLGVFAVFIALVPYGSLHNLLIFPLLILVLLPLALASSTALSSVSPPTPDLNCSTEPLVVPVHPEDSDALSPSRVAVQSGAHPPRDAHLHSDSPRLPPPISARLPVEAEPTAQIRASGGSSFDASQSAHRCVDPSEAVGVEIFENPLPLHFRQMIVAPDAWLVGLTGAVVIGGGNTVATFISQVIHAGGGDSGLVPRAVTVFTAGNQLGRLTCMVPSNWLLRRGWPRPLFTALISLVMALAHLAFAASVYVTSSGSAMQVSVHLAPASLVGFRVTPVPRPFGRLLVAPSLLKHEGGHLQAALMTTACFLAGSSFGAIWPHLVVLSSELFGSAHLAMNYMFLDGFCSAFGTLALANMLPGLFDQPHQAGKCSGSSCFGPTHLIISALCLLGAVTATAAAHRSEYLYIRISYSMRMLRKR